MADKSTGQPIKRVEQNKNRVQLGSLKFKLWLVEATRGQATRQETAWNHVP